MSKVRSIIAAILALASFNLMAQITTGTPYAMAIADMPKIRALLEIRTEDALTTHKIRPRSPITCPIRVRLFAYEEDEKGEENPNRPAG